MLKEGKHLIMRQLCISYSYGCETLVALHVQSKERCQWTVG